MEFRYTIKREYVQDGHGFKATGNWILFDILKDSEIIFYDWKYLQEYITNNSINPINISC